MSLCKPCSVNVVFRRDFPVLQNKARFTRQEVALPLLWLST